MVSDGTPYIRSDFVAYAAAPHEVTISRSSSACRRVTVAWCVSKSDERCTMYDSSVNLRSGAEYPVGRGYVMYGACAGPDSMWRQYEWPQFSCED